MADPNDYNEEIQQIRDCIEETFKKLCSVWDEIGSYNAKKRQECKMSLVTSCVEAISQQMNRVYELELSVAIFFKWIWVEKRKARGEYSWRKGGSQWTMWEDGVFCRECERIVLYFDEKIWRDQNGMNVLANKTLKVQQAYIRSIRERLAKVWIGYSVHA